MQDLLAYDQLVPLFTKLHLHDLLKFILVSDRTRLRAFGVQFLKNLTEFDIDLILDLDNIVKSSDQYKSRISNLRSGHWDLSK